MIAYPTSDIGRLTLLRTALATAQQDQALGRDRLPEESRDALPTLIQQFETAIQQVVEAKAARAQASTAAKDAMRTLEALVRQVWSTVQWRVRWEGVSPQSLTYYGLPVDGPTPFPRTRSGWLTTAAQILAGDAAAVAAGLVSALDAEAFNAAYTQAESTMDQLATARQNLRLAQKDLLAKRRGANKQIRRLVQDLRYALRDEPPSLQREIMRTYGVRFKRYAPLESEPAPAGAPPQVSSEAEPVNAQASVMGWRLQTEPAATAAD